MKKLMLLGGSRYLIPVIEKAHELGIYVITCDYLPDNAAHKFSDEYRNVSIVEKENVLDVARQLNIDGIMSFACDPGVTTASYVAEKMDLPNVGPYESVCILQNKGKFRKFLRENGFNVPKARSYTNINDVLIDLNDFTWPIIVKPTDSAGSKGVTKVTQKQKFQEAAKYAMGYSLSGEFIVEEYIEQCGYSSDADTLVIDGEIVICSFSDQIFDENATNPFVPAGFIFPSSMPLYAQIEIKNELQRLFSLLGMKSGLFNVESRIDKNGIPYIMECSPRAGGNRLSELIENACGQDVIISAIKSAIGENVEKKKKELVYHDYWGEAILHSDKSGIVKRISTSGLHTDKSVRQVELWVETGDRVNTFTGANETIGMITYACESRDTIENCIANTYKSVIIEVEN